MGSSTRHGGGPPTPAARAPHGTSPFPVTRVSQSRSAEDLSGARRSPSAARHPRHPGAGWMRVADVLADEAGAQAGNLRPLREVHLRSRHSSPSADSNRSSPSGAAPTATQTNRWSLRSAATGAGVRRLRLLSVTVFPVSLRLGWQCPRLPTDYVNMAKVPHRAHETRPVRGMSAHSGEVGMAGSWRSWAYWPGEAVPSPPFRPRSGSVPPPTTIASV